MQSTSAQKKPDIAKRRNASIDWMRAGCILYIVGFWHLHNYTGFISWYGARPFYAATVAALGLFVLISGYLIGKQSPTMTFPGLANWYRKRLIRLYPPYLVALLVFFVGGAAVPLVTSMLLVAMIVPPAPFTLWFVTMIVLFYVAAPFLLRIADSLPKYALTVGGAWVVLFCLTIFDHGPDPRLLIYLPVFAAGILIGRYDFKPSKGIIGVAVGAAAIAYVVSQQADIPILDMSLWQAPWATFGPVAIFVLLSNRLPYSKLVEQLSIGSYFLYLFHRPIYLIVIKISRAQTPFGKEMLLLFVGMPVAIVFGILAQRIYDAFVAYAERKGWLGPVAVR